MVRRQKNIVACFALGVASVLITISIEHIFPDMTDSGGSKLLSARKVLDLFLWFIVAFVIAALSSTKREVLLFAAVYSITSIILGALVVDWSRLVLPESNLFPLLLIGLIANFAVSAVLALIIFLFLGSPDRDPEGAA